MTPNGWIFNKTKKIQTCNSYCPRKISGIFSDSERLMLGFSLFILGAKVLIPALAAAGCADRIACVAMHTYFHIE